MYLTAQRVKDARGREGINVYGYSHPAAEAAGIDWQAPNVAMIAERHPGRLMFSLRAVEGTGNSILSYLDVAIADQVPARTVADLLQAAMTAWSPGVPVWLQGPMALRFQTRLTDADGAAREIRALKDELVFAVAARIAAGRDEEPALSAAPQPLCVLRKSGHASYRFELDTPSREFLAKARPDLLLPAGLNITYENLEAFRAFSSSAIEPEAIQALTHLSLEQIDALAGGLILAEDTGEVIWRSPGARA